MQRQHEICTIAGCKRQHKARGYCSEHYQRWKRGAPMDVEIATRDTTPFECCKEEGCAEPVKAKGLCKMHYARLLRHGHTMYRDRKREPKICSVDGCSNWVYAKGICNQHYMRDRKTASFGLSPEQVAGMLAAQGGRCAVCQGEPKSVNALSGKITDFAIDHDHATGAVRGLLCSHCNRAIGLLQDDPAILTSAILYLARYAPDPATVLTAAITRLQAALPPAGTA